MLITGTSISHQGPRVHSLETPEHLVFWQGLVYIDGALAGAPSMERFLAEATRDLAAATTRLKGVYVVFLINRQSGRRYVFCDQSGLFHSYYSGNCVSTSFLDLAEAEGLGPDDLGAEALIEFLHFGAIYFGRTFFEPIRRIQPDQIISLTSRGTAVIARPICRIEDRTCSSLEGFLGRFARAVSRERVSLDLTGGIDSRMLAVVLDYFGLPFELAASGMPGNTDLRIAQEVAGALGHDLHVTYHAIDDLPNSTPELFRAGDGMRDIVKCHRPLRLQQARVARGVSLMVSGAGGELYKDFWWLQDFPFYSRRQSNLERLCALRIIAVQPRHTLLSAEYWKLSLAYREKLLRQLAQFVAPRNTETYDQIYYHFKNREIAGQFLTAAAGFLDSYAPYLEREAVSFGYGMPRRQRFFNNFHRQTITRLNPQVARVPTTEGGMTVSAAPSSVAADLAKYVANRLERITQKVGQKVFKKTYLQESPNHPDLDSCVRQLAAESRVLEHLKSFGILHAAVQLPQVPGGYLGTLLTLHLLLERLEVNSTRLSHKLAGR